MACLYCGFLIALAVLYGTTANAEMLIGFAACEQPPVPWHISLNSPSHTCSGALINQEWALAPAQCCRSSPQQMEVVLGKLTHQTLHGKFHQLNTAAKLIPHEQFNNYTLDFDIMLIKLMYPAEINEFVAPVDLPSQCVSPGTLCRTSEWTNNNASGNLLQCTNLPITSEATCSSAYPGRFTDRMLCAGQLDSSQETCKGDVGGPLVCDGVLQGLLSWAESCSEGNRLGLYTKICNFETWIHFTMANN